MAASSVFLSGIRSRESPVLGTRCRVLRKRPELLRFHAITIPVFPSKGSVPFKMLQLLRNLTQASENPLTQTDLFLIQDIGRNLLCLPSCSEIQSFCFLANTSTAKRPLTSVAVVMTGMAPVRFGKRSSQFVCAPDMTGQKGNGKDPFFIHDHHGRILSLIRYKRGNAPHSDACGSDKKQAIPAF